MKLTIFAVLVTVVVSGIIIAGVLYENRSDNFKQTPEMAQNLVYDSIELYEQLGTKAFPRISVEPEFRLGELYVVIARESDGIIVADGYKHSSIGNVLNDNIRNAVTTKGVWVEYTAADPINNKVLPKSSWVVKYDGYIFVSGIYHPDTKST